METLIHSTPVRDRRHLLAPALLGALCLLASCGGWRNYGDTYYARKPLRKSKVGHEATYSFGMPPKDWRPAKEKDSVSVTSEMVTLPSPAGMRSVT